MSAPASSPLGAQLPRAYGVVIPHSLNSEQAGLFQLVRDRKSELETAVEENNAVPSVPWRVMWIIGKGKSDRVKAMLQRQADLHPLIHFTLVRITSEMQPGALQDDISAHTKLQSSGRRLAEMIAQKEIILAQRSSASGQPQTSHQLIDGEIQVISDSTKSNRFTVGSVFVDPMRQVLVVDVVTLVEDSIAGLIAPHLRSTLDANLMRVNKSTDPPDLTLRIVDLYNVENALLGSLDRVHCIFLYTNQDLADGHFRLARAAVVDSGCRSYDFILLSDGDHRGRSVRLAVESGTRNARQSWVTSLLTLNRQIRLVTSEQAVDSEIETLLTGIKLLKSA